MPPVLIIVTLGRLAFRGGNGAATNAGLLPAPVFSIPVSDVIVMPML